ncbi:hypothetical protein [Streptomyces sp. NPDC029674]|uniref:hypothetical protein n=1 Tax=Streptomyces sp. NPDC029674 TaxID=3365297 RepID=UPI00384C99C6
MADGTGTGTALFPPDARDKLTLRLQNAVNGFVDEPRTAVEAADRILEETIADLTHTLAERRRTLRTSWQSLPAEGTGGTAGKPSPSSPSSPSSSLDATPPATGSHTPTGDTPTGDTEQLRLALRDYRETAERLLRL